LLQLTTNDRAEALEAFDEARKYYSNPEDIIRVAIHEVGALEGLGRGGEAVALARKEIGEYPKARAGEVLQMLEPLAVPARVH
jgi:hypothetical protein